MTDQTFAENWDWANDLFESSDFAPFFYIEDDGFDPKTGDHYLIDENGYTLVIDQCEDVLPKTASDLEALTKLAIEFFTRYNMPLPSRFIKPKSCHQTFTADWSWADEIFNGSDFADIFEVEDSDFNPETGEYSYFDEAGNRIVIDQDGNVLTA